MRTRLLLLPTLALAMSAVPSLAHAKSVCGPTHKRTLAHSDFARVYVDAGQARSCHRGSSSKRSLGPASRVLAAKAAGSFVAVRRRATTGDESLRVYNAYTGLAIPTHDGWVPHAGHFTALRLADNGLAAYVATLADGRRLVSATGEFPES